MKIDFIHLKRIAGTTIFNRGKQYFNAGRVNLLNWNETSVESVVYGSKAYRVRVKQRDETLYVECSCPYYDTYGGICKHIVATLLEYDSVETEGPYSLTASWKDLLPHKNPPLESHTSRLAFLLTFYRSSWQIEPVAKYIRKDGTLGHERTINIHSMDFSSKDIEASSRELLALQFLKGFSFGFGKADFPYGSEYGHILNYLSDSNLFYVESRREQIPITFLKDAFNLYFTVEKGEDEFSLKLYLKDDSGKQKILVNNQFLLLSSGYVYFYHHFKIYPVKQNLSAKILLPFCSAKKGLQIPKKEFSEFLTELYPILISNNARVDLPPEIQIVTAEVLTKKALYLSETNGELRVTVSFFYSDAENGIEPIQVQGLPFRKAELLIEDGRHFLVKRQKKAESLFLDILKEHQLLKSADSFVLPKKTDALIWVYEELPKLAKKGFEIYGEEKLNQLKVRRVTPQIISRVSSDLDWFDLEVEIDFDGLRMSYRDVLKSLKKNKRFIRLSDGSAVKIDDRILKKLGLLQVFADHSAGENRIRLAKSQALLIDEILQDSGEVQADAAFKEHLQKLKNFKKLKSVQVPKQFKGQLRPYQKSGLDWLAFLNEYELGGCLADDMGLGKTVQALALLQLQKEKIKKNLVSLIVAPTSVVSNWQREAAVFTPRLKVYVHSGAERIKDPEHFKQFDLIITSYTLIWRDFDLLKEISFYYVILDESQKIKNPVSVTAKAAYRLKARHRLVMTGTPIENNLTELWSQFQFINPGMLGQLQAFSRHYGTAIEKQGDQQKAEQLRRIIYPFILRRTKEMVVKELPPKVENVLFCTMNSHQQTEYEKWRDYYRALILKAIDKQGLNRSKMKVLAGLMRLRQLAIHPAMVEQEYKQNSGKFEALEDLLEEVVNENHKVLLFSQFVKALSLVRKNLEERQLPYLYLDGRTKKRQELVDRFQQDENTRIFLISLKAGGLGLNLTSADYVIHLDPWWNPAVEAQAMDRAHRIGQTKKVFVYKMITKGTVEEKILELQKRKKKLAEQLITTDSAFFKNLEKEDILHLFS